MKKYKNNWQKSKNGFQKNSNPGSRYQLKETTKQKINYYKNNWDAKPTKSFSKSKKKRR